MVMGWLMVTVLRSAFLLWPSVALTHTASIFAPFWSKHSSFPLRIPPPPLVDHSVLPSSSR